MRNFIGVFSVSTLGIIKRARLCKSWNFEHVPAQVKLMQLLQSLAKNFPLPYIAVHYLQLAIVRS